MYLHTHIYLIQGPQGKRGPPGPTGLPGQMVSIKMIQ